MRKDVALQLEGWRMTTAEIIYHMPDHPGILQSFVWQKLPPNDKWSGGDMFGERRRCRDLAAFGREERRSGL